MDLPVTYLRREPTTDQVTAQYAPHLLGRVFDVQSYSDSAAANKGMARWPWHYRKSRPTRRNRYVTLGGMMHRIVWLPDLNA